jgi:hypothetical protein
VQTLKKPFSNHEARYNWYIFGTLVIALIMTTVYTVEIDETQTGNIIKQGDRKVAICFMFAFYCISGLCFIYSVLVSWQKMCYKDAFGKDLRRMVMVRHIVYMSAFCLTNVYPFMNTFAIFKGWALKI